MCIPVVLPNVPQATSACDAIRAVAVNRKESNMAVGTSSGRVVEVSRAFPPFSQKKRAITHCSP